MGYLCFTAEEVNSSVTLIKEGNPSWTGSYSLDGANWTTYTPSTTGAITLANVGDKVYFKGIYTGANSSSNYLKFQMTGKIAASGNIMSFCSGDNYEGQKRIPYNRMFCYLFKDCTSLTTPPELPATLIVEYCYRSMFQGCTSLTAAPDLPAVTLSYNCYYEMFSGCTSLTAAPDLPATRFQYYCYGYMFNNCTSLSRISLAYTGNLGWDYMPEWVYGVSATGTFYYNGSDTTRGTSAIPSGWTVKSYPPPPLPHPEKDKLYEIVKPNITADEQIHDIVYIKATDSATARERYISLVTYGSLDGHTYDPLNEYRLEKPEVKLEWGNITGDMENQTDLAQEFTSVHTEISNLKNIGRFCAIWNASTGAPTSEPLVTPYTYKTGDYFRIGVAGYKVPTGDTYVPGAYDTVTEETGIGDVWYYDGTNWVKQASSGGGTVQDVQVNGISVLSGGIANVPVASDSTLGVVRVRPTDGITVNNEGRVIINRASDAQIQAMTSTTMPIVPANLNKAIMEGLGNNSLTWSTAYKTSARTTIGAGEPVEIEVW